jgi:hypothetical protein
MKLSYKLALATSAAMLATGVAASAASAATTHDDPGPIPAATTQGDPIPIPAVAAAPAAQPTITSVAFSGYYGTGVPASPTVTIGGSGFGSTPPAGVSDNSTSCGGYTANGEVFGASLYFLDVNNFEAGYSDADGANCIGVVVVSWSPTQVVYRFGSSYASFDRWYLMNGDSFDIDVKGAIYGGIVSGLI